MVMKNRLRVLRAERELTQRDIGQRAGIELTRYWSIEKGYSDPREHERAALSAALGVDESVIWPELAEVTPAADVAPSGDDRRIAERRDGDRRQGDRRRQDVPPPDSCDQVA